MDAIKPAQDTPVTLIVSFVEMDGANYLRIHHRKSNEVEILNFYFISHMDKWAFLLNSSMIILALLTKQ